MLNVNLRSGLQGSRALPIGISRLNLQIGDHASLIGLLAITMCGFLVRLGSVVVSDMDEGTYIYAGKLVAQGQLPYRDFLLTHPPLIALFTGAAVWLFGPEIMGIRYVYMALV